MVMVGLQGSQGAGRSAGSQVVEVEMQSVFARSWSEKVWTMFRFNRAETEDSIVCWRRTRDGTNSRYWW